ncbi:MAG TPA: tRNA glutamyl-Q(34) synthetase GluQRS [Steroidobacteraceae bacterium]
MNVNTAIATTATAENYRGRFAPSPSGFLHLGSLLAATGSYLQARAHGGSWLVRIEDLDAPRMIPGAADQILRTLEHFGFEWDGPVTRQSDRLDLYRSALDRLTEAGLVYPCSCTRQELASHHSADPAEENEDCFYPGTCRAGPRRADAPHALRFRAAPGKVEFTDVLQGAYRQNVATTVGDFVVRRKDGLYAYQLAVVVDDGEQGITEVVRGCDLLSNTPRQILLRKALDLSLPRHLHLPLLVEADGRKLAKSRRSVPVAGSDATAQLHTALVQLRQQPPAELARGHVQGLMTWAIAHWNPGPMAGLREIRVEAV